jgi:hypothetical protein
MFLKPQKCKIKELDSVDVLSVRSTLSLSLAREACFQKGGDVRLTH